MQKVDIHWIQTGEGRQVVDKSLAVVVLRDSVVDLNCLIGRCEQLACVHHRLIGRCVSSLKCRTACKLIHEIQLSRDWTLERSLAQQQAQLKHMSWECSQLFANHLALT